MVANSSRNKFYILSIKKIYFEENEFVKAQSICKIKVVSKTKFQSQAAINLKNCQAEKKLIKIN